MYQNQERQQFPVLVLGNLKAIGKLVEGMDADQVIALLQGNTCGRNFTSCADQLTKAILEAKENIA